MWFSGLAKRHNLSERLAETISDDRKAASTAENAESLFQKIELILSVHKLVISDIYAVDEVGGRLVRQRKLKKVVPKGAQHPRARGDLLAKWTKTPRQVVACVGGDGTLIPPAWIVKPTSNDGNLPRSFYECLDENELLMPQANGKMDTDCFLRWMKHFQEIWAEIQGSVQFYFFWIKGLVTCLMKS